MSPPGGDEPIVHLVIGPDQHGVVRHGVSVAGGRRPPAGPGGDASRGRRPDCWAGVRRRPSALHRPAVRADRCEDSAAAFAR